MSKRSLLCGSLLCALGLTGVAAAKGFPNRVGLTRSEAALSLPGDLIFPQAEVVADRAKSFRLPIEALWPKIKEITDLYQDVWDRPMELVYSEEDYAMVWRTLDDPSGWNASLAAVLLPGVDGQVTLHLRERYTSKGRASRRMRRTSAFLAPFVFRRLRKEANVEICDGDKVEAEEIKC